VRFSVLGEFSGFTLNYEENVFGGIWIYAFLELWAGSHVGLLRGGTLLGSSCVFGGILGVGWGFCEVLTHKWARC
jgi:hypothetical protein